MPLGIEQNSIAPQLIQNAGQALVQGIRQIGQQVSSHLTEIQTRRDIGALGQELQNISVESPDWSTQVTGLLSRHPLAARDERAQMALSILSKAHNQWQENQATVRNPYRSMAGGGVYNSATGEVTTAPTMRPGGGRKFSPVPGGVLNNETGEVAPLPAGVGSPTQARTQRNFEVKQLQDQLSLLDAEIKPLEKKYNEFDKREKEFTKDSDKNEVTILYADRGKVGKQLEDLGKRRNALREQIRKLLQTPVSSPAVPAVPAVTDQSLGGIVPQALAPEPDNSPYPTDDVIGTVAPNIAEMKPQKLSPEMARKFLQEVGGDKTKARQLATERGFVF